MGAPRQKFTDSVGGIGRTISVYLSAKLIVAETHLVERARRGVTHILAHYRECTPEGIGLECHYYLYTGIARNRGNQFKIAAYTVFIYYIIWCGELSGFHIYLYTFILSYHLPGSAVEYSKSGELQKEFLLAYDIECNGNRRTWCI